MGDVETFEFIWQIEEGEDGNSFPWAQQCSTREVKERRITNLSFATWAGDL